MNFYEGHRDDTVKGVGSAYFAGRGAWTRGVAWGSVDNACMDVRLTDGGGSADVTFG